MLAERAGQLNDALSSERVALEGILEWAAQDLEALEEREEEEAEVAWNVVDDRN